MLKLIKKWFNLGFYMSKLDQFLFAFDKKHPRLSASQRAEKEKYTKLFQCRDNPEVKTSHKTIWDQF